MPSERALLSCHALMRAPVERLPILAGLPHWLHGIAGRREFPANGRFASGGASHIVRALLERRRFAVRHRRRQIREWLADRLARNPNNGAYRFVRRTQNNSVDHHAVTPS